MKIKSVRYERLFNVGEYQNETIGFIADIEENEKPQSALAKLYDMVTTANKKINKLLVIANKLYALEREDSCYCSTISYSKHEILRAEQKLKELKKEKSVDAFIIDRTKSNIKKYKNELNEKLEQQEKLTKEYRQMVNDFKKGGLE